MEKSKNNITKFIKSLILPFAIFIAISISIYSNVKVKLENEETLRLLSEQNEMVSQSIEVLVQLNDEYKSLKEEVNLAYDGVSDLQLETLALIDNSKILLSQVNAQIDKLENYTPITSDNVSTYDLRNQTYLTEEALKVALEDAPNLQNLSSKIVELQEEYKINGLFVISVARLESGNGKSGLAINSNNIGGIRTSSGYRSFDSKEECLEYMFQLLSTRYLIEDGKFYGGGFTTYHVNKKYCELDSWSGKVNSIMLKMSERVEEYYEDLEVEDKETVS